MEVDGLSRIALIGLPGSGKSSVGRLLSHRLHHQFVDLDELIATRAGTSIPVLFETMGEAGFRDQEKSALDSVTRLDDQPDIVVATGGGIVVTEECRTQLRQQWISVYLQVSIAILVQRLELERQGRPLLRGEESLVEKLNRLYEQRGMWYKTTAHVTVNVDKTSPERVVDQITEQLPPHIHHL